MNAASAKQDRRRRSDPGEPVACSCPRPGCQPQPSVTCSGSRR